jgi:hypothetical protein
VGVALVQKTTVHGLSGREIVVCTTTHFNVKDRNAASDGFGVIAELM